MKKIVLLFLICISNIALYATEDNEGNGSISIDVLKPLSIRLWCNGCSSSPDEYNLPDVTIGSFVDNITGKYATFIIEGSAGKNIIVTTDGPSYEDISDEYVTIDGRWGSYDNGTQPTSGTFGAKPTKLGDVGTPTQGQAFCNYYVDKITAAPQATVGPKLFIITVSVEYDL